MKKILFSLLIVFLSSSIKATGNVLVKKDFDLAQQQTKRMLEQATNMKLYPRTTAKDGSLRQTDMYDWTSGFFPGNLWYLYEFSNDENWKQQAIRWTESLEALKTFTHHHDLGFMMYCSYGNAYRLTGNTKYKEILIRSAESLATRFSPKTKCIESWNYRKSWDGKSEWFFPVIIDNMMNLELLFFASKQTGDKRFYDIAVTHANTTLKNHFRKDFGTYHVVDYDTITGAVLHQQTCQGYADASTWARGQAWAIYGYTMTYRETKDKKYLNAAIKATDFFLNHKNLPADYVPYWDFNALDPAYKPDWKPDGKTPLNLRDASAAAIVASALFELNRYVKAEKRKKYYSSAVKILNSLSSNYTAKVGENNNFVLKHSVGSFPHNAELDVPLVYADYYFLEALLRYNKSLK